MYNDPTRSSQPSDFSATGPTGQQFTPGTSVYDVNGHKVGTIASADPQSNSLVIQKGLFFHKDIPVPMSAIDHADADGVYLNLSKDDVSSGNFSSGAYSSGTTGYGTSDREQLSTREREGDINVPVREEELQARKLQEEQGRVRIHKDVIEEQQTVSAPVTHEEVNIERRPVDRPMDVPPDAWQEKDIDVPLHGEELSAEKRGRVAEEVRIEKQPVTEEQQVSGTVRKEQVRMDNPDDVPLDERASDQERFDTQP